MEGPNDLRCKECHTVFIDKEHIPEYLHPLHAKMLAHECAKEKIDEEKPMQVDLDTADRENREGIKKRLQKKQEIRDGLEESDCPVPEKLLQAIKQLQEQLDDAASEDPDVAGLHKKYLEAQKATSQIRTGLEKLQKQKLQLQQQLLDIDADIGFQDEALADQEEVERKSLQELNAHKQKKGKKKADVNDKEEEDSNETAATEKATAATAATAKATAEAEAAKAELAKSNRQLEQMAETLKMVQKQLEKLQHANEEKGTGGGGEEVKPMDDAEVPEEPEEDDEPEEPDTKPKPLAKRFKKQKE